MTGPCVMCHTIGGTDARGMVGPPLTHIASRPFIGAGTLPNSRGHLAGWIVDPRALTVQGQSLWQDAWSKFKAG